jgi:hypothetical protein
VRRLPAAIVCALAAPFVAFIAEVLMFAINKLEQYIRSNATPAVSLELRRLLEALKEEKEFPLSSLYEIDYEAFELAVEAMRDWRIDRYYAGAAAIVDRPVRSDEPESTCAG